MNFQYAVGKRLSGRALANPTFLTGTRIAMSVWTKCSEGELRAFLNALVPFHYSVEGLASGDTSSVKGFSVSADDPDLYGMEWNLRCAARYFGEEFFPVPLALEVTFGIEFPTKAEADSLTSWLKRATHSGFPKAAISELPEGVSVADAESGVSIHFGAESNHFKCSISLTTEAMTVLGFDSADKVSFTSCWSLFDEALNLSAKRLRKAAEPDVGNATCFATTLRSVFHAVDANWAV